MSAQRARSSVAAERRSAHPNIPGVPWWGAVLIAVTGTSAGFAFDAGTGSTELTKAFAAMYVIGCVAAVLAVRQSGVFTAVVQPPLILFVAVPAAYYLFHRAEIKGVKDVLINCGYPLIERFLLMFSASVAVLLIGMARWYFASAGKAAPAAAAKEVRSPAAVSGLRAKLSALWGGGAAAAATAEDAEGVPRKHTIDRPATAEKPARGRRPAKRPVATRSRHVRPPVDDPDGPPPEPRRRRPSQARDFDRDFDRDFGRDPGDEVPPPPRRRPRTARDPGQRTPPPPRQYRRDPRERDQRDPRERDQRDPRERDQRDPRDAEPYDRPAPRRNRYEPYEPYPPKPDPYEEPPPRRRPAASGNSPNVNTPNGTHHPVSKVRYRDTGAQDGDSHVEYRTPPRARHSADSDRWRYEP